ncbi:hypothetical protein CHS0354_017031 [Potamilus streckersoni]|uniref:BTB domain-containing protein n=1 Tax=Potamilus streckersoni TaxID=2493646 RepID=A0AAE0SYX6_9BIVA|nr:hypothetical protein CHS0354_017031 [Potamilus streckersoni]
MITFGYLFPLVTIGLNDHGWVLIPLVAIGLNVQGWVLIPLVTIGFNDQLEDISSTWRPSAPLGGHQLHFAKFPLIQGSDVLAQMIEKSADQSKLVIDNVAYEDILMFLECLHPKTLESITDKNLQPVLSIAKRFEHKGILKKCDVLFNNSGSHGILRMKCTPNTSLILTWQKNMDWTMRFE